MGGDFDQNWGLGLTKKSFKVPIIMFLYLIISKFGVENGYGHFFDQN